MQVDFKFELEQRVKTTLGCTGIVRMLGYDLSGKQYSVQTREGWSWYREKELELEEN